MLSGTGERDCPNRKDCFQILSDLRVNRSLRARWGERFRFRSSQYARYMEARHDLGKFITELPVAERGAVLSSGRELLAPRYPVWKIAQGWWDEDGTPASGQRRGSGHRKTGSAARIRSTN